MRIVVSDVAARHGGALTILQGLLRHLEAGDDGNEWFFLVGGDVLQDSEHLRCIALTNVTKSWWHRLVFDFFGGWRQTLLLKPDVVFSMQNTILWGVRCPQVLYIHQAIPFQNARTYSLLRRDERQLAVYQHLIGALIKLSARNADRVIVQSEWMRAALIGRLRLRHDAVHVIPPHLGDVRRQVPGVEVDVRQFLYPTDDLDYKNNRCLEEASRILVARGVTDFRVILTIGESGAPNVDAVGRLPRDELLLQLARSTLVFPSLIETVGLPLLEARALGVVVLAANLPYARETLAGYANAHFFDPNSPDDLATLMLQVMTGEVVGVPTCEDAGEKPESWSKVVDVLTEVAPAV